MGHTTFILKFPVNMNKSKYTSVNSLIMSGEVKVMLNKILINSDSVNK